MKEFGKEMEEEYKVNTIAEPSSTNNERKGEKSLCITFSVDSMKVWIF